MNWEKTSTGEANEEEMNAILNAALLICATLNFITGISYWVRERKNGSFRVFVLLMGIGAAIWCFGYGFMGMCENFQQANVGRAMGMVGVVIFLMVEMIMGCEVTDIPVKFRRVIYSVMGVVALADAVIMSLPNIDIFVRLSGRTAYYATDNSLRHIHTLFLALICPFLGYLGIRWYRRSVFRREKTSVGWMIAGNTAMLIGTIPDFILPAFSKPSIPTSGIGVTITFMWIWFIASRLNTFNITTQNLGNYLFNSVNNGVLVFDSDTALVMANAYAVNLLRMPALAGVELFDLFDVTREEVDDCLAKAMEGVETAPRWRTLYSNVLCSLNFSVAKDNKGAPYCVICIINDLTKEEEIMKELEQANRAKSDFLANMSHEIRTPINAVLGMDEMILRESTEQQILEYAGDINNAGRTLLSLINDILDFSKIESGKLELVEEKYSLSSLLSDCYNMIQLRAAEKGLEISFAVDPEVPAVFVGDEIRLRQVITNLLTNAVKYTEKGSVTLRLKAQCDGERAWTDGDTVCLFIEVEDTGIGIKEEGLAVLFDHFQRLDEKRNRSVEGTGLGLAITKALADMMGGTISVSSVYGEGSVFSLSIPQVVCGSEKIGDLSEVYRQSESGEDRRAVRFTAPDARILVVDDVAINLTVFTGLLKHTRIHIDTASSGAEALKKIDENAYHMIFMDHMMPEMDGIEVMRLFRLQKADSEVRNSNTPMIMLTANAIRGAEEQYRKAGFTDYLTKPIQSKSLEKMILSYLPAELVHYTEEEDTALQAAVQQNGMEEEPHSEWRAAYSFLEIATGVQYCGGDEEMFRQVVSMYPLEDRGAILQDCFAKSDWENYRIQVHALKSSALSIGATALSTHAKEVELALKEGNTDFAREHHEALVGEYRELISNIEGLPTPVLFM